MSSSSVWTNQSAVHANNRQYFDDIWINAVADFQKEYIPSVPTLSELDINKEDNLPSMYKITWSKCLRNIVLNFLRTNGILIDFEDIIIPKSIYDLIAQFYSNDITKRRSYEDYMNAILICKYFSELKLTKQVELSNENDKNVKLKYKLTTKSSLTTSKIFKALKDFKLNE